MRLWLPGEKLKQLMSSRVMGLSAIWQYLSPNFSCVSGKVIRIGKILGIKILTNQ
jgi:hypothetical protein